MASLPRRFRNKRKLKNEKSSNIITPALIISIITLVASVASTYLNWFAGRDSAKSQVIREAYGTFYEMNKLQVANWQQSHLFALPDQYPLISGQLSSALEPISLAQRSELVLKERAIADFIFTLYEENFYRRRQAEEVNDTQRFRFLTDVENYLTGRVLRNPRLLWYWDKQGGGLSQAYEFETQQHYKIGLTQKKLTIMAISMQT